jgi:MFS family permease
MKKIAFIVAAASLFAIAPIAHRFGPVASSVALVWLGVLVAICASGTASSLAVTGGALGAFGSGVLATVSPAAAGAVIVAAAFAERTTRVRSKTARAVHVLVALVGGALAGSLSTAFTASSIPVLAVAIIVSAVLAALPLLVDADDPVAHALEQAARDVSEPAKASFLSGADLRRQVEDVPLDKATRDRVKKTWQSLLRLAEARVRLEKSRPKLFLRVETEPKSLPAATPNAADQVLGMVDQKISEHVQVLAKAYTAVDTARAAAVGLDDSALKNVEVLGETLEEESRAMVEVKAAS